jgi:hypothetical protein
MIDLGSPEQLSAQNHRLLFPPYKKLVTHALMLSPARMLSLPQKRL